MGNQFILTEPTFKQQVDDLSKVISSYGQNEKHDWHDWKFIEREEKEK